MSVQSEIERIKSNIEDAYAAVREMGGTTPSEEMENSDNLSAAIRGIPLGSQGPQIPDDPIIDVTLEEDVASLLIETDKTGAPFELTEFFMLFESKPITGQTVNNRCRVAFTKDSDWQSGGALELKAAPKETEQAIYQFLYCKKQAGYMLPVISRRSYNYGTVATVLTSPDINEYNSGANKITIDAATGDISAPTSCTAFKFIGVSSVILGAGSRIRVWGA